jgi:hypothetical protein
LRRSTVLAKLTPVAEDPIIDRETAMSLVFMVADISVTLKKLYALLGGEDEEEEAE